MFTAPVLTAEPDSPAHTRLGDRQGPCQNVKCIARVMRLCVLSAAHVHSSCGHRVVAAQHSGNPLIRQIKVSTLSISPLPAEIRHSTVARSTDNSSLLRHQCTSVPLEWASCPRPRRMRSKTPNTAHCVAFRSAKVVAIGQMPQLSPDLPPG